MGSVWRQKMSLWLRRSFHLHISNQEVYANVMEVMVLVKMRFYVIGENENPEYQKLLRRKSSLRLMTQNLNKEQIGRRN